MESLKNHPSPSTPLRSTRNSKEKPYRSFIFVVHEQYGILLLHCTRKKNKPHHYQIPGGHVDDIDYYVTATTRGTRIEANQVSCPTNAEEVEENTSTTTTSTAISSSLVTLSRSLQSAGTVGVARELYEETGIDLRTQLQRICPVPLYPNNSNSIRNPHQLQNMNEYKHRLFYSVIVTDMDFALVSPNRTTSQTNTSTGINVLQNSIDAIPNCSFSHVQLSLSVEHSGFTFELHPNVLYNQIKYHSGGKVAQAFAMAYQQSQNQETHEQNSTTATIVAWHQCLLPFNGPFVMNSTSGSQDNNLLDTSNPDHHHHPDNSNDNDDSDDDATID
jgi:8-oxo-dGTP pyrophosphatase MutT (NUDIX family)